MSALKTSIAIAVTLSVVVATLLLPAATGRTEVTKAQAITLSDESLSVPDSGTAQVELAKLPYASRPEAKFSANLSMVLGRDPVALRTVYLAGLAKDASDEQRYLSYVIGQSCFAAVIRQPLPDYSAFPEASSYRAAEARKKIEKRCVDFYAMPITEFRTSKRFLDDWYSSGSGIVSAGFVTFGRTSDELALHEPRLRLTETLKAHGTAALAWVSEALADHLIALTSTEEQVDPAFVGPRESLFIKASILAKCDAFPDACGEGGLLQLNVCSATGACGDLRQSLVVDLPSEDRRTVTEQADRIVRAIKTGKLSDIGL